MKKKILLFSSSIVLLSGLIMSYSGGPALNGENRTGTSNGGPSCAGNGCHTGTGNYTNNNLTVSLAIGATPVSTWKPDSVYTVIISGSTTAPKYGFQLTSAWYSNMVAPAGTFTTSGPGVHAALVSGFSIFEHEGTRTPGTNGAILHTATWTAPPASTIDSVTFYLTVNNVNGTGSIDGDNSTNKTFGFKRATTSVATLNADIIIAAYPNPVTDKLNITLDNAGNGTYSIRVFDVTGKTVATQTADVKGSYTTSINAASWAKGMYHVQLQKDGAQRTIAIMK